MDHRQTIFSQVMDFFPMYEFSKCLKRYNGNYRIRNFTCWNKFLCLAFAQLTYRESLRDIESCLNSVPNKLYHMRFRGSITHSTLADANEKRDWRIYADFAQILIHRARSLYQHEDFCIELDNTVYALDSTTIDLCLSLFPWAKFRTHKGAVKMHTVLDLRVNIPTYIAITPGKVHDVNVLDQLIPEPGAFYVMDRGYVDFSRLYQLTKDQVYFVTRAKSNLKYRRLYSNPVDKTTGLQSDQKIQLEGFYSPKEYSQKLRRVRYFDQETEKYFTFLTNNFAVSPITVTHLYRSRWQIELFF